MRFLYEGKGSQKRILIVLEDIGGCVTQQQLTELLGIRPGSVSEVIAKLESMGYISRTPNKTDRRTVDIALTESGKIAAEEASTQRRKRHELPLILNVEPWDYQDFMAYLKWRYKDDYKPIKPIRRR